jgi:hypothetical protein
LYPVDLLRSPETPNLPAQATFFSNGKAWVPANRSVITRPAPYAAGFKNAIYTAGDFVSVGNYTVPKAFHLVLFKTKTEGSSSNDLAVAAEWRGNANVAEFVPHLDIALPVLRTNTIVRDYRTTNGFEFGVKYVVTNNEWRRFVSRPHLDKSDFHAHSNSDKKIR